MANVLSEDIISLDELIDQFLLRRLRELGLSHEFGVWSDFNLELSNWKLSPPYVDRLL